MDVFFLCSFQLTLLIILFIVYFFYNNKRVMFIWVLTTYKNKYNLSLLYKFEFKL